MNDNDTLSPEAFSTVTSTTTVTFRLTEKPGTGSYTCLQMLDKNGNPFPGEEIPVFENRFIEFINATTQPDGGPETCGTLVIFFEKGPGNRPGTPIKDGHKVRLIDPNQSWTKRVVKLSGKDPQIYTFTAVALTAGGDVATFDPRIIIKPQTIVA